MRAGWVLVVLTTTGCSFELGEFRAEAPDADARVDASVDTNLAEAGATDVPSPDDAPVPDAPPVDAPALDTSPLDAADADVVLMDCVGRGNRPGCVSCCAAAYPAAREAVTTHVKPCLCKGSACQSVCNKTYCHPSPKAPDGACWVCIADRLDDDCQGELKTANGAEPQVSPYSTCLRACREKT
jgi:hypothetical protein